MLITRTWSINQYGTQLKIFENIFEICEIKYCHSRKAIYWHVFKFLNLPPSVCELYSLKERILILFLCSGRLMFPYHTNNERL